MSAVTLRIGDCLEVMRELADGSVDAVVTDPPYGISFMGKHWDRFDIEQRVGKRDVSKLGTRLTGDAEAANRKETARTSSAFANAAGEAGGYDFTLTGARRFQETAEMWAAEWLRLLKPGGYAVVFGSTRMYHRLAAGIEDAGFEIRDTLAWMFGQGFPKSLNLHGEFEGWGTALKPGYEPIVLARKPLVGTTHANMDAHGVGALNLGACGIPVVDRAVYEANHSGDRGHAGTRDLGDRGDTDFRQGGGSARDERWPANVLLDEEAAWLLDAHSGELISGQPGTMRVAENRGAAYGAESRPAGTPMTGHGDRGGASRFFYCAKVSTAERNAGCEPTLLNPDAPDRNDHPTVKPLAVMRWLIRLVMPEGATVLDPFCGSGSTACAALLERRSVIGIEREQAYADIARARIAHWSALPVEEIAA